MEPANDSDEIIELMCKVENLQLRLKKAGESVNPTIEKQFAANIASATQPSERIKKWKRRVEQLKDLLATLRLDQQQLLFCMSSETHGNRHSNLLRTWRAV